MNVANSISTKASTRLNGFFVVMKFVSIAGVVVAGLIVVVLQVADPDRKIGGGDWFTKSWFGARPTAAPDGTRVDWSHVSDWELLGHFSAALYGSLWGYSGWDKVRALWSWGAPGDRQDKLTGHRLFMCLLSFRLRRSSSPSPSTPPFPLSFYASSPPMLPIMSCCRGM